ncbi:hypothetical protein CBR_g52635 [Chara braunii]|uniref:Uncharacterized protein n=1 Tax=Chara braunii TaxID=69332 RepID=A0A388MAW2_CHABU|nr:hypothetical protein CBR_g52635 [Chara braunii]|eukprot:GBG91602.1 hypothetical protein CBR_g52635 [Chara braunii]
MQGRGKTPDAALPDLPGSPKTQEGRTTDVKQTRHDNGLAGQQAPHEATIKDTQMDEDQASCGKKSGMQADKSTRQSAPTEKTTEKAAAQMSKDKLETGDRQDRPRSMKEKEAETVESDMEVGSDGEKEEVGQKQGSERRSERLELKEGQGPSQQVIPSAGLVGDSQKKRMDDETLTGTDRKSKPLQGLTKGGWLQECSGSLLEDREQRQTADCGPHATNNGNLLVSGEARKTAPEEGREERQEVNEGPHDATTLATDEGQKIVVERDEDPSRPTQDQILQGLNDLQLEQTRPPHALQPLTSQLQNQDQLEFDARKEIESLWDEGMEEPQHVWLGRKREKSRKKTRIAQSAASDQDVST